MSTEKSQLILSGVTAATKSQLLACLNVQEGRLPLKYLGVPLTSKKINISEYYPLISKITAKVTAWTAKFLSFAGRLQLIQSVIFSIQNFWSSLFLIPKAVLKMVERICRNYLWSSQVDQSRKNPVAWKDVCRPKKAGGLGLKNMLMMNKALMINLLWDIHNKVDSLWIKWMHVKYFKGVSMWDCVITNSFSWTGKGIMKLRNEAWKCIQGNQTALSSPDEVVSTKATFQALSAGFPDCWWGKLIWSDLSQPRCSFIAWLAVQERLMTKDRLRLWNLNYDASCVLCERHQESHHHLFFDCEFARNIWLSVCLWQGWKLPHSWMRLWNGSMRSWRKGVLSRAKMATLNTAIYHIWRERNARIFDKKSRDASSIIKSIVFELKVKYSCIVKVPNKPSVVLWCNKVGVLLSYV